MLMLRSPQKIFVSSPIGNGRLSQGSVHASNAFEIAPDPRMVENIPIIDVFCSIRAVDAPLNFNDGFKRCQHLASLISQMHKRRIIRNCFIDVLIHLPNICAKGAK